MLYPACSATPQTDVLIAPKRPAKLNFTYFVHK